MSVSSMWSDPASGNIGFSVFGESHGEDLETFFILQVDDIPSLLYGGRVLERESMFADSKWKPKVLSDIDLSEKTFVISDPGHTIETTNVNTGKTRKKVVTAVLTGTLSDKFDEYLRKACECALFSVSQMPHKTSKDRKSYDARLSVWLDIARRFSFDESALKMAANSVHFGLMENLTSA